MEDVINIWHKLGCMVDMISFSGFSMEDVTSNQSSLKGLFMEGLKCMDSGGTTREVWPEVY